MNLGRSLVKIGSRIVILVMSFTHASMSQEILHPAGANIDIAYSISSTNFNTNDTIRVHRSITNREAFSLIGLYLSDNLPPALRLIEDSLKINGVNARHEHVGPVLDGDIVGYNAHYWAIDDPGPGDSLNRALAPGERLDLEYVLVVGTGGNYAFPLHTVCFDSPNGGYFSVANSIVDTTYAVIASAGPNGTITPSGRNDVPRGSSRIFAISANSGYSIVDVLVDGVSIGPVSSYTFLNVTSDHTISARFSGGTLTIAASAGAGGTIAPAGNVPVPYGQSITFTITPMSGYYIQNVTVDGQSVGPVSSYTFSNVTSNHTISASFTSNGVLIRAAAGSNGTISPSGYVYVAYGSTITFTMTPSPGYRVYTVYVDSRSVGAVTTYTFANVTTSHTIVAYFTFAYYTITASAGPNGTISPSGNINVRGGSNLAFAIVPNAGYRIADVLVDSRSVGPVSSYTFTNIESNHTIYARFTTSLAGIGPGSSDNQDLTPLPSGDINLDGALTSEDVLFGLEYLRGSDLSDPKLPILSNSNMIQAVGDVNGDCVFNGLDINYIIRFLKGRAPTPKRCGS